MMIKNNDFNEANVWFLMKNLLLLKMDLQES